MIKLRSFLPLHFSSRFRSSRSASGFEFRPRLHQNQRPSRSRLYVYLAKKIFPSRRRVLRLPPLLSLALRHWRTTLIIRYRSEKGEMDGGPGEEMGKRGLERREWLDARPTYQDNGFHRSRCSVYTNPWQGVALDFHCIALSLTGVESERASERARAHIHTHTHDLRARVEHVRYVIFALPVERGSVLSRKNEPVSSPYDILQSHVDLFAVGFSNQTFPLFPRCTRRPAIL